MLNGEEICFTRGREKVYVDFNDIADCQNLQKIVNYDSTNSKYVITEVTSPVTVESVWIILELHEPAVVKFDRVNDDGPVQVSDFKSLVSMRS